MNSGKILLEVVVDSPESALAAERGGAGRLEVCTHLQVGGLFPGKELIRAIRKRVRIPIHVMIRPRPGGFVYTDEEILVMKDQIRQAIEEGADGLVFGLIDDQHAIDWRTRDLVEISSPHPVTFHRAFDEIKNPLKALEAINRAGMGRLLTSGQRKSAWEGKALIRELVTMGNGVTIIAGAGINRENVLEIVEQTGVVEIHVGRGTQDPASGMVSEDLVRRIVDRISLRDT